MKRALLVIDMQNICVGEEHADLFTYDNTRLIDSINRVIDKYEPQLVYYIQNVMKRNLINRFAPFQAFEGSREIELVKGIHVVSEHIFKKYTGDSFSNQKLQRSLKNAGVQELELVGVDGGGCVALTAFGGLKAGYQVLIHADCVGTVFEKRKQKYFKKLEKLGAKFI